MGIVVLPMDSDDIVSITISGVPSFEKVTAGKGETVTHKGSTYTVTTRNPGTSINDLTLTSSFKGKGAPVNRLSITTSNTTPEENATSSTITMTVTDPPAVSSSSRSALTNSDLLSPAQQNSLLWTGNAKLHDEMVASLHDALASTSNDTPLLYDSHSALFRQAMASFGTNGPSTAHDSLLQTQYPGGLHEPGTNDTHTLALTPAAASADTILAVSHHG
jgi:hypothetical protein